MQPLMIGSVVVDDQDCLNVLWFEQGSMRNLFLSQAHTGAGTDAQNWTTRVLERPALAMNGPDLVARPGGRLYVVYALDHNVIVFRASEDYGRTWPVREMVSTVIDAEREAVTNPRVAVDGKGYVHTVWTVSTAERDWSGEAVYYARSTDQGRTWEETQIYRSLPEESTTSWISVAVRAGDEIHLAWNRGIGSRLGRYHSWSPDNGQTWYEPVPFLPEFVSGQTSWPLMVEDGAGVLHLLTVAGGPPMEDGVSSTRPRYAYWDGDAWSGMVTFSESTGDLDIALAIGLGHQLHLVHEDGRFEGGLLYNSLATGAQPVPTQQIPDPLPTTGSRIVTATPSAQPTPTETPPAAVQSMVMQSAPPDSGSGDRLASLILAIVPVVVLLVLIMVWRLRRRDWR